jgi:hypothetical protein
MKLHIDKQEWKEFNNITCVCKDQIKRNRSTHTVTPTHDKNFNIKQFLK